ncbi:MAG: molybdopterin-dependent oxidoreductase [Desulfovibrionaceae bacterium]
MENRKSVNSVCGMCSSRCPITVEVEHNSAQWIYGNPHSALQGALCARGAAGIALEEECERPQSPLVRVGPRGSGQWKAVTWDEAFDQVAAALQRSARDYGPQSILWSDRDGPFTDLHRAFMRGLGSPNICTHGVSCDLNAHHAIQSVLGLGRGTLVNDYAHCKHLVLQSRNIFEALNVAEARAVGKALQRGCRLTVIDVRPTISAAKADTFFCIRPGTDYAFNLAIIHTLIAENLYQHAYVRQNTVGFETLAAFVQPYTPAWAEHETGIRATAIIDLARQVAASAPQVIWHPGWMASRYSHSFQVSRTALIITALLGGVGTQGGFIQGSAPQDVGKQALKKFTDLYPASSLPRVDGVGTKYQNLDTSKGLLHKAITAIASGQPYPIKAYIAWRHDPVQSLPDPQAVKQALDCLDLLVSATFSWSDTAWYADIILPLSSYLARESIIATKGGLKPQFFVRRRAVEPRYNTCADWEIISGLSKRLGLKALVFTSPEELWAYQLQGTGLSIADFAEKGFVELCASPHYPEHVKLPTTSGKIELTSASWQEKSGLSLCVPYTSPAAPPSGAFRVVFGRCALHTQGHTMNNPLLAEQMPENVAWVHPARAQALGLSHGERVQVLNARGQSAGTVLLHCTEGIHPEALFMVHGFGHQLPCESRAFGKGVADNTLLCGGLTMQDAGGGGLSMQEHFVTLKKMEAVA